MKQEWKTPQLEVLNVSKTMLGEGTHFVDWTIVGGKLDLDITDTDTGYPLPTIPGVPPS
ncbi:paeninodin family lasso peptide [Paenibacillus ihuae]|uniref:paeninodin family lasso peptide n=1 Tax=Paenibacillus ihuae TaxID=1232431 RepID=UPI000D5294BB